MRVNMFSRRILCQTCEPRSARCLLSQNREPATEFLRIMNRRAPPFQNTAGRGASDSGLRPQGSTFKNKQWVNPSRTLYVTNVPPGVSTEELEKLFKHLEGFLAFRRVRSMCFVDFEKKQQATAAMWSTNGHRLRPQHDGLLVSYDKDDNEDKGGWSIRQREEEKQRRLQVDATRSAYRCAACGHFCLKLARPLPELPERRTDGSRVVDSAVDLVTLISVKGGQKLIKREKGVERQFRYHCELCELCLGYRPVPYEQDSKFIYIFPEAVVDCRSAAGMSALARHHPTAKAALPLPQPPPQPAASAAASGGGAALSPSTAQTGLLPAPRGGGAVAAATSTSAAADAAAGGRGQGEERGAEKSNGASQEEETGRAEESAGGPAGGAEVAAGNARGAREANEKGEEERAGEAAGSARESGQQGSESREPSSWKQEGEEGATAGVGNGVLEPTQKHPADAGETGAPGTAGHGAEREPDIAGKK